MMLQVEQLTKRFGKKAVVSDVAFELVPNTITALIGPNGAGKTTTLSMLAGLLTPTSGIIRLDDPRPVQQQVGFLPQYPKFFEWMTAFEYVNMMGKLSGLSTVDALQRANDVLRFVGLYDERTQRISSFSGGMKQRLGIAQAILHRPKLLLLDEPVSALDPIGRSDMMKLLRELAETTTILYSTHILHDAQSMTEYVLFMKDGRLVEQGHIDEVQQKYDAPHIAITFVKEADALQFASQSELHVSVSERVVTVEVHNNKPTMQHIMSRLATSPFQVEQVAYAKMTLEQTFMKVVGEDA
ncbi:MAG: ABC transporter ATP-binding protein [Caryophanon sp.]|nr:ABC transporter ATP-binding protein [Caryophanon sp.]